MCFRCNEYKRKGITIQTRSKRNRVDRENMIQECGNPIVEDDFHGFSHRNCEGTEQLQQLKIRVFGIVQGVGFRPFVSRLAAAGGLRGTVCNKGSYVEILVQGEASALMRFQKDLKASAPERSVILKMDETEQKPESFSDFQIIESKKRSGDIFVSPDIAICPTCKTELYDKNNRRFGHPFINCTACGP